MIDRFGDASFSLPIPTVARFAGARLRHQWFPIDRGMTPLQIVASAGAEFTIGNP